MIEKKVEGQEIKAVAPAPRRTGQVVDIFAALKKSLETAGQQKSTTDRTQEEKEGIGSDAAARRLACWFQFSGTFFNSVSVCRIFFSKSV